jgi:excisionase family DNA binding protein
MDTADIHTKEKTDIRLLPIREVAQRLGISPKTVYNGLNRGTFPIRAKRWGRKVLFDIRDVQSFINELPYDVKG